MGPKKAAEKRAETAEKEAQVTKAIVKAGRFIEEKSGRRLSEAIQEIESGEVPEILRNRNRR